MIPLVLAAARPLAQTEDSVSLFDLKTVLLIVVTATLFFVAFKLMHMHRRLEALETASPFPPAVLPSAPTKASLPPQTVAAISAAVHTTLSSRHKILSIGESNSDRQAWSLEGRRQVFHSHKVR